MFLKNFNYHLKIYKDLITIMEKVMLGFAKAINPKIPITKE